MGTRDHRKTKNPAEGVCIAAEDVDALVRMVMIGLCGGWVGADDVQVGTYGRCWIIAQTNGKDALEGIHYQARG